MRKSGYLIYLVLLVPGLSVHADIYRCSGTSGEPSFSQLPCGVDSTVAARAVSRPAVPAEGVRPSERAWLRKRARVSRREGQPERQASNLPDAAKHRAVQQAFRCQKKRRALDSLQARMRRGYKPAQGEKLRRRRAGYEDYLAALCP